MSTSTTPTTPWAIPSRSARGTNGRLTQQTQAGTNYYSYDDANRLTEVDGVSYAWSANGNLLSDGSSTYTYDHANRLTDVVKGEDTYSYAYNGLGDRLQQTVNGEAMNYTLDTVTGLTQVLDDGANAYLYGLDRVGEEQPAGWAYHIPDALGSVRQLTDADADVTLARAYEPFGSVMASNGSGETNYSFTGEWADGTGLMHLRARYYAPWQGRFSSSDMWVGNPNNPLTLNLWIYATDNPIRIIDPSGMAITEDGIKRGIHVYSCNCGWLDFHHANPILSKEIYDLLRRLPSPPSTPQYWQDRVAIKLNVDLPYLPSWIEKKVIAVVKTGLSDGDQKSVTLGIHMGRETYREGSQYLLSLFNLISNSGFSDEDFASNLIGFYLTINGKKDPKTDDDTFRWLAEICGFNKNRQYAIDDSLEAFKDYQYKTIFTWGSPLLKCPASKYVECPGTRKWPSVFNTVKREPHSYSGLWWWYRLKDGFLSNTDDRKLYFLKKY